MKYLFFDLEYASHSNGESKICEFGYVLTDENFTILEQDNLIINPNINRNEWDYRVLKTILTRKMSDYLGRPIFSHYFKKIKSLITNATFILGHSLDSDVQAINCELKRYQLESLDFPFYDVKHFYKSYNNSKNDTSVTNILKELNIQGDERVHDAMSDSYNVMLELKVMIERLEISLPDLVQLCPGARNYSKDYKVESIELSRMLREEKLLKTRDGDGTNIMKRYGVNRTRFHQFLEYVKPTKMMGHVLDGKKVSISKNYEDTHFRQLLNLIQLIVNQGGQYVTKGTDANLFVRYDTYLSDGTLEYCSKLRHVLEKNTNEPSIEIISIDDLFHSLDITEAKLDLIPAVSFEFLSNNSDVVEEKMNQKIIDSKDNIKHQMNNPARFTIEEILREKGFDLSIYRSE